jgi:3-oxoacyl-[acyl-carrier protein] reductase
MKTHTDPLQPDTGKDGPSRVLVVGASASVGKAVVERFLAGGASVLATTRRHGLAPDLVDRVMAASLDLTDPASLDQLTTTVASHFGHLDVVVFLSGRLPGLPLSGYSDELMYTVMATNFTGQASLLRRLEPHLSDGASVLFVSSVSAERGSFDPIYAASKAAQIALVKSLATWMAPAVRVNAIAPALIDGSSMFKAMTPERRAHHLAQTPTGRLTTPQELAEIVWCLCAPPWANVNGQVIRVNGGAHV